MEKDGLPQSRSWRIRDQLRLSSEALQQAVSLTGNLGSCQETEEKLTSTESCCSLVCCEPGALRLRGTGKQEEELQPELRECR